MDRAEMRASSASRGPMTVVRRRDIAAFRVKLLGEAEPVTLNVAHVDLYFFYDIDIAILAVELFASDLPLATVQNVMFQLGRAYPAFWHTDGKAGHCPETVELLAADGRVLARSDYEKARRVPFVRLPQPFTSYRGALGFHSEAPRAASLRSGGSDSLPAA